MNVKIGSRYINNKSDTKVDFAKKNIKILIS